jgi:thymidylate kinase
MLQNLMSTPTFTNFVDDQPAALSGVRKLFEAFAAHNIRYCHWKSNVRLEHGLLGRTDLDLLVSPQDAGNLRRLLTEHNIKHVFAPLGKRYPGIEDYLGLDYETGKLFHLHVHYLLVLGEQFVKNYQIPLEEAFLNSTISVGGWVNVPAPELELSILCMRALLKYRDRDLFKDIFSIRSPGLPAHIRHELDWLQEQVSDETLQRVLSDHADILPAETIREFLATYRSDPRAGFTFWRLRSQVRRSLARFQRHGRLQAMFHYFQEVWRREVLTRLFGRPRGMTFPRGGQTITLLGADGAGKTTLVRELDKWLSWRMDIRTYYLGSKQPAPGSTVTYFLFRIFRKLHNMASHAIGRKNIFVRGLSFIKKVFIYQHYLFVGYERHRRFTRGKREAKEGAIVLFDRFPFESPLDGPEIENISQKMDSRFVGFFSQREKNIYTRFGSPDFLIILDVTPEISARRKPDHSLETIRSKKKAIEKLASKLQEASTDKWATLNGDLPLEDVLLQLKRKIWAIL